jgi:peptide/nickel transport system substrate-binding protein
MRIPLAREIQKFPFTPSDWVVIGILTVIALAAVVWFFSAVSYRFTTEVPAKGGTYAEGIVGTPRFINPLLAISDADRDLVQLTFAGLLHAVPDGTLVPDIAENYSVSEDGRTYTFTIRKDATFHDGTPITAEDVAFTVAMAQNPAIKSPKRANWEGVMITIVDAQTISFTLKDPYAPFLSNATIGILPKHLWANVSAEEFPFSTLNTQAVGEGPYRIDSITTNAAGIPNTIALSAFTQAVRVPYISHIKLSFFSDTTALHEAMTRDASLSGHTVDPSDLDSHVMNEAILGRVFGVFFNQNQNDLFANKAIRSALDTALDKQALVSTLIHGYGSPIGGPLPPEAVTAPQAEDKTPEERLQAASDILTKDGWTKGDDGVFVKKTKKSQARLQFTLATANAPELKAAAEAVAATWRSLGVDVTTQFFEQNDLQQGVIRPRKYDALLFGEVVGRDLDLFAFWDSSQRNDPGLNIALYTNAKVDTLLERARTEETLADRRATTEDAATIISDEVAAVFLYSPHFVYLTPKNLSGLELGTIASPSDRFLNVTDWYVSTERVWPFLAR